MKRKNANNKQTIKCDVNSCSYNDCDNHYCELNEIKVSCTCDGCNVSEKAETICNSYKKNTQ